MTPLTNSRFEEERERNMQHLYDMGDEVEELFRLILEGFDRFRADKPREAIEGVKTLQTNAEKLTLHLIRISEGRSTENKRTIQRALKALGQLQLICRFCCQFSERVIVKVEEGILFSDKAFGEIKDLYYEISSLLHHALRAFKKSDRLLAKEVAKNGIALEKRIDTMGTEHEKRLISGICAVRSSAIFLDMLESLRGIVGHAVVFSAA